MVEAGANEIPEAEILDALDIAHSEIKKLVAAHARARREGRQDPEARGRDAAGRRGPARADQGLARAEARRGHLGRGQARPPGRHEGRRGGGPRAVLRRPEDAPSTPSAARQGAARVRQAREVDHPRAHRDPEEAPGRPRHGRDPRRSRSRPACCRARTAPRCSRAARRRRCPSPRSAPRARRCGSTRSGWRPPSATSTTTTSRPSRSGRPASCAARSAATSATARSPSGRSSR